MTQATDTGSLDYSKVHLHGGGHAFDSFSKVVEAASELLGKKIDYDSICCLSTVAFAPTIDLGESCTAWWNMVKDPSIDIVAAATGMKITLLPLDPGQNPHWSDAEFDEHRKKSAVIIQNALASGQVVIADGGWSNPPDKPFAPWCWWGIITEARPDGTILGICLNGHQDNEIKWLGNCWTVEMDLGKTHLDMTRSMLKRAAARIRSDQDPYQPKERLVYGLDAMDKWIEKMGVLPFCPDCHASAPDRVWTCAHSTAEPVFEGAKTVAAYLRSMTSFFQEKEKAVVNSIIGHYEAIALLLEPALKDDGPGHYKRIIGDLEKQNKHIETVLVPIKQQLKEAAADMIEF